MSQHPSRPSPASAINVYPLDHIEIPPSDVGQTLQGFLNYGSERASGVTPDDITVKVSWIPATSRPGLRVLLRCGMKFFDAVYWLAAGQVAGNRRLVVDRAFTADKIPSLHTVSQAVFDVYAFLLKEGKYPSPQNPSVKLICSFDINKIDPSRIKYVSCKDFGLEALPGLISSVAGYRLFEPFRHCNLDLAPLPVRNAVTFAKAVAIKPPTWAIHPVTRSTAIFWKRGDLEKELGNLILDVFSNEDIQDVVEKGTLSARPKREPSAHRYLTWDSVDDITGDDFIFANQTAS